MKVKKLLVLILSIITIIMCVCFAGCGDKENEQPDNGGYNDTKVVAEYVCISIEEYPDNALYIYTVYDKQTKVVYVIMRSLTVEGDWQLTLIQTAIYNGD